MTSNKNSALNVKNYNWSKLALELIVVFLGITSGFFLNNWQSEQEEKKIEQKYISAFLQDANYNIPEIEEAIENDSIWLNRITPKLSLIRDKTISIDSVNAIVKLIIGVYSMELHVGTYEDIKNSGNLNIISNFKLKSKIVDYHISVDGVKFIDDYFYQYFNDFVMPFIFEEYDIFTAKLNNKKIIKSIRFSNVIAGYYSMVQQRFLAYKELLKESKSLKKDLLQNIKSPNTN